jgi:hypothetical protein
MSRVPPHCAGTNRNEYGIACAQALSSPNADVQRSFAREIAGWVSHDPVLVKRLSIVIAELATELPFVRDALCETVQGRALLTGGEDGTGDVSSRARRATESDR